MAGEPIPLKDSPVTVCTGASSLATGAINTGESITTINSTKKFVDFTLTCTFGVALAAGKKVFLYRRSMNIDGASDAPQPSTTYRHKQVGWFDCKDGTTASQTLECNGIYCPHESEFYIGNETGQTMLSGYVLKGTAWIWAPAT